MSEKIVIMSKPRCVQCTATMRAFDKLGSDYETIDISLPENVEHLNRALALGYSSAPIVFIGEQHWSGYRPDHIKEAVAALESVEV